MKKPMNFRFALCLALAVILAVSLAVNVFISQVSKIIVISVLSCLCLAGIICLIIFKKKFISLLICIILVMLIPFVSVYSKTNKLIQNNSLNVEKCNIYGKIYKTNIDLQNNSISLYLTDVELSAQENRQEFYGKFLVVLNANNADTSGFEIGRYVNVWGKPEIYTLGESSKATSYIARGINGMCKTYSYSCKLDDKSHTNLRDNVRNNVYDSFEKTDKFYTATGFAMLFGESTVLESEVYDVFKATGISHLLAVSGFHVSIIIAFVMFILKKLKSNKYANIAIVVSILSIYAYLCDFSVSVIRASIMSLVLLYSSSRNKEYDRLSALSLSACLILLVNPLDLFNISFVLSFVAVLSIILLMPLFERLLSKIFYNKFASMLSLSLSTSLGLSVFQLFYFGKMPLLSFVANMVTVPIVSFLFIFLILSVLIGSIFGFAAPLISLFGIGMKYVLQFNNWVAGISLNLSVEHVRSLALTLSLVLMFVVSDYVFLKKRDKIIVSSVLGVGIIMLMIF